MLAARSSDHRPFFASFHNRVDRFQQRKRPFKFGASWTMYDECKEVIKAAWGGGEKEEVQLGAIQSKLRRCQQEPKRWSRETIGRADVLLKQKTQQLEVLQASEGPSSMENITQLQEEIQELMEKENLKWKKRGKGELVQGWRQKYQVFSYVCKS